MKFNTAQNEEGIVDESRRLLEAGMRVDVGGGYEAEIVGFVTTDLDQHPQVVVRFDDGEEDTVLTSQSWMDAPIVAELEVVS